MKNLVDYIKIIAVSSGTSILLSLFMMGVSKRILSKKLNVYDKLFNVLFIISLIFTLIMQISIWLLAIFQLSGTTV